MSENAERHIWGWTSLSSTALTVILSLATIGFFYAAIDLAIFVYRLDATTSSLKLDLLLKLSAIALLSMAIASLLVALLWRNIREPTFHDQVTTLWSAPWGVFLFIMIGSLYLIYYPIPPHSHHLDKILIGCVLLVLWVGWILFQPDSLNSFTMSRPYHWFKIALINLVVFLIVGECFFRLADPIVAGAGLFGDAKTPAGLKPYARGASRQGFRDSERSQLKKSSTMRVVALGDSFTWGVGVEPHEVFPARLEEALGRLYPNAEVINLGVPGYDPSLELDLLKRYGLQFDPDLVMLNIYVGNDIIRTRDAGLEEPIIVGGQMYFVHVNGNWIHDTFSPERWFIYHDLNYLFTMNALTIKGSLASSAGGKATRPSPQQETSPLQRDDLLKVIGKQSEVFLKRDTWLFNYHWNHTVAILEEFRRELSGRGITLVLVILPDQVQVNQQVQLEFLRSRYAASDAYDFDKPQRLLREWAESRGVEVIDLLEACRKAASDESLYVPNDIHWNSAGHRAASAEVLPRLIQILASLKE